MIEAEYLGDAVYASFDGHHVILTTGHHDPSQSQAMIALEPSVMVKLQRWNARLEAAKREHLGDPKADLTRVISPFPPGWVP